MVDKPRRVLLSAVRPCADVDDMVVSPGRQVIVVLDNGERQARKDENLKGPDMLFTETLGAESYDHILQA